MECVASCQRISDCSVAAFTLEGVCEKAAEAVEATGAFATLCHRFEMPGEEGHLIFQMAWEQKCRLHLRTLIP